MVANNIKVFARVRNEHNSKEESYHIVKKNDESEDILFYKPPSEMSTASSVHSKFRFTKIFDKDRRQEEVFNIAVEPVVTSILQGFNGTIFAYGQTGSGKTYTMTGSARKYEERGIIPRSLQHIFSTIEKTDEKPTLYISYMEIYNEICYDLLCPRNKGSASCLEELPRVTILEDKNGQVHLRNLSIMPVTSEEEAMRLLFLGDTNRVIAETPLNEYSSRSHCIFTIYISSRPTDNSKLICSKLNLVDLAGSERVYKSKIVGNILNEAKHINRSLHFLQQVFLALSESRRTHIPYRNSVMTLILKDSLAGSCLTVMLATLSVSRKNIPETISTCKFAQRVSLIKTDPVINKVSDPYQEILQLKTEVQELRKQLAVKKQPTMKLNFETNLSPKRQRELELKLDNYLIDCNENLGIDLDATQIEHCFSYFKNKITSMMKEEQLKEESVVVNLPEIQSERNTNLTLKTCLDNVEVPSTDVDYYLKQLSSTYEKAKYISSSIEECQWNINHIREKLDIVCRGGDSHRKFQLKNELGRQQSRYRSSLMKLKKQVHSENSYRHVKPDSNNLNSTHDLHNKQADEMQEYIHTMNPEKDLECQQSRYRNSLMQLKELRCETMQLEAGLEKAKMQMHSENTHQHVKPDINSLNPTHHLHNRQADEIQECIHRIYPSQFEYKHLRGTFGNFTEHHLRPCQSVCCQNECMINKYVSHEHFDRADNCFCLRNNARLSSSIIRCNSDYLSLPHINHKQNHCEPSLYEQRWWQPEHRSCGNLTPEMKLNDNYPNRTVQSKCIELNMPKLQHSNERADCCYLKTDEISSVHPNNSDIQLVPNKLCDDSMNPSDKRPNEDDCIIGHSPLSQEDYCTVDVSILEKNDNTPTENMCMISGVNKDLFLETDTEEFKSFIRTIELTGDMETDNEICAFYRSKLEL